MENSTAYHPPSRVGHALAWLAFTLAVYYLMIFALEVTGVAQSVLESNELIYNLTLGLVPTLLWLALVGGLWFLCRNTGGAGLMTAALGAILLGQVLENLWPRLPEGPVAVALMWTATLLSLGMVLLLGLGLQRSGIVSSATVRIALFWGVARALVVSLRIASDRLLATNAADGVFQLQALLDLISRYGLPFVRIAFLVAVGASLVRSAACRRALPTRAAT